jgi:hypothetical protein
MRFIAILTLLLVVSCQPSKKKKVVKSPLAPPVNNENPNTQGGISSQIYALEDLVSFNNSATPIEDSYNSFNLPLSSFSGINIVGRDVDNLAFSTYNESNISKAHALKYLITNEVDTTIEHFQNNELTLITETNGRAYYIIKEIDNEIFIHSGKNNNSSKVLLSDSHVLVYNTVDYTHVNYYKVPNTKSDSLNISLLTLPYTFSRSGDSVTGNVQIVTDQHSGGVAINSSNDYSFNYFDKDTSSYIPLDFTGAMKTEVHNHLVTNYDIISTYAEGTTFILTLSHRTDGDIIEYALYGYKSGVTWTSKQLRLTTEGEDARPYDIIKSNYGLVEYFYDSNEVGKYLLDDKISPQFQSYITTFGNNLNITDIILVKNNQNLCLGKLTGETRCFGHNNLSTSHINEISPLKMFVGGSNSIFALYENGKIYAIEKYSPNSDVFLSGFSTSEAEKQISGTVREIGLVEDLRSKRLTLFAIQNNGEIVIIGNRIGQTFGSTSYDNHRYQLEYFFVGYNYIGLQASNGDPSFITPKGQNFINSNAF